MASRVVITGMGLITPLGFGAEKVFERLLSGASGVGRVSRYDAATFKTNFAAEVKEFDLRAFMGDEAAAHLGAGVSTQFALAAAKQAFDQAGLSSARDLKRRRFGMYLGAGEGSLDFENYAAAHVEGWDAQSRRLDTAKWARSAYARMDADRELEQEPQMTLAHVASAFGCRGPSSNCMTACAASTQAVGEAFEILRRGDADVMFAGGAHSMIHPLGMTGFIRLTAMSRRNDTYQTAARPFDATRDGFVMGEGAAMLVLETEAHAIARGARPLAEIAGYGSTADAFRITDIAPEHRGAQGAMQQALRQAGINPREPGADGRPPVQYVCAHGTGTKENDKLETAAVKAVFGPLASRVPVSSVKSMMGHLIQAAGAAGTIVCVQSIRTGKIAPTINLQNPDPECDLDYVANGARDVNAQGGVSVCLNNSAGFGGQNDTVCVQKYG